MATPECMLCRFVNHTLVWRPSYKRSFSAACLGAITSAVKRCEASSAAQVCVIAEHTLPYSYLRKRLAVRDRAIMLFGKHRVWDTEHNTGVLIYVNWVERAVEIVADRGISVRVPQAQWDAWAQQLRVAFSDQEFQTGIVTVIDAMRPVFAAALPRAAGQHGSDLHSNYVDDAPIVL
jgi:uncharacterized membrane protein